MKETGDEYFDSEEFREMLSAYEEAVEAGQPVFMDADELSEIADYYQMTDDDAKAEAAIELALSLSPGAIAPLTYKIHEALYMGDTDEAERLLEQIIEKDSPDYVYNRAEVMLAKGEVDQAENYFREQLKTMPPTEWQDYIVDVASIYSDYDINDKAMEWMAKAKHEDSPDFKELMARTLFGLGKYKDSERLFNELIDTNPFSKHYWNALASAQFMNEDYSGAIQSSEYAIAIDPDDPESIVAKANGLYRINNWEEALEYYKRYTELVPDDEFAMLHVGTCLINMGRSDEAVEQLTQALDAAQDDSPYLCDLYQELAFAYSDKGEADKALQCLDKTDDMECDHVQIQVIKGHVLLAANRMREAEEQFKKAIIKSDDPNHTLLRVIVSVYDNKYIETTYKLFKRFFSIVGDDFDEGHAYMALCCYDLKRYDEFLSYLKTACQRNAKECRLVVGHMFPDDIDPSHYYEYIKEQMKK